MRITEPRDIDSLPGTRWHMTGVDTSLLIGIQGNIDEFFEGDKLAQLKQALKTALDNGMLTKVGNELLYKSRLTDIKVQLT